MSTPSALDLIFVWYCVMAEVLTVSLREMGVRVSWQKRAEVLEKGAYNFFALFSRFYSERKAACFSEMSLNFYRNPRGQISVDADLYSYWAQNLILICHFYHLSRPFTSKPQNKINFCINGVAFPKEYISSCITFLFSSRSIDRLGPWRLISLVSVPDSGRIVVPSPKVPNRPCDHPALFSLGP